MVNEGRSSGQDNASREGVDAFRDWVVGAHSAAAVREALAPAIRKLSSARTSAEAPSTDCPSPQPKDVT